MRPRHLFLLSPILLTAASLSQSQLDMFKDADGWEYIAVFDSNNGVHEQHTCFVEGHPDRQACHGVISFSSDNKFHQTISIHGATSERNGTYQLDDDQLTLTDELGTKDGPYKTVLDTEKKSLRITMDEAGVAEGAELQLESEYRKHGH